MLPIPGDLLPYSVPVALSPLPIIAAVTLLLAPSGVAGGVGFVAGRLAALIGLSFAVALIATELAGPGIALGGWMRIVAGCLVLVGAGLVWRGRPQAGAEPELPGWMRMLEGATPGRAVRLGMALTALNIKELAFVIGAGLMIGSEALPTTQTLLASLVFGSLAGLGVLVPTVWILADPDHARSGLGAARDWLARNNAIVVAAVLLAIGTMLIGSGLEAL